MARTTGKATVADMIAAGLLNVGEPLSLHQRNKPDTIAKVTKDGGIKVGTVTYTSPSAAAKAVLDVGTVQGWTRWHVTRLDKTLHAVRTQLT